MENNSDFYSKCDLCPRHCLVNRLAGQTGFCKETSKIRVACAGLHFGEEPPITVIGGSGTIFVTGCNLQCAFCQNYQISQNGMGKEVSEEEFADICILLQNNGAENINVVTGSHAIPAIANSLRIAKQKGLNIPVCWNSSSYEKVEELELLKGLVDIWLPDLKTLNSRISSEVFKAEDYPSVAKKAIRWMIDNSPIKVKTVCIKNDEASVKRFGGKEVEKMLSGVIIRHLFLPGRIDDTVLVLDWLKKHCDGKAFISLMSQYTPVNFSGEEYDKRKTALSAFQHRLMSNEEFSTIRNLIEDYDFEQIFYQELSSDTDWLPDFTKYQPFSSSLSKPLWHWNVQKL